MTIEGVKGAEYSVEYSAGTNTVAFIGTIRLQTTDEYAPIMELLQAVHGSLEADQTMGMDFRQLRFLNSSGINTISRFIITARKADSVGINILGNQDIYWQQKSLKNLQRLWPKVQIEIQ